MLCGCVAGLVPWSFELAWCVDGNGVGRSPDNGGAGKADINDEKMQPSTRHGRACVCVYDVDVLVSLIVSMVKVVAVELWSHSSPQNRLE